MKLSIEIDNITEAQAIAIEDFLATWLFLKEKKMRMWTAFFADGSTDFKPIIKIDGKDPVRFDGDIGPRWNTINKDTEDEDEVYFVDYERIESVLNGRNDQSQDIEQENA
jgi:hypothetical protein